MQKCERTGMQADTSAERANGPILGVAVDGMAVVSELHAQLVRTAGLWPDFQPGQAAMHGTAMVVQERLSGALVAWLDNLDAAQ
jgi:hypothetical protein